MGNIHPRINTNTGEFIKTLAHRRRMFLSSSFWSTALNGRLIEISICVANSYNDCGF
jgi:hypothetical protein